LNWNQTGAAIHVTSIHADKWWSCLSGLVAFGVYWFTLAPTLQVADAGEQIAAAHFMGISHPTGTPLYLLLMKLWELIFPLGTIAWRMNVLNALLGAATVGILCLWILRLSRLWGASGAKAILLALSLCLTLAYSRTFWYESTAASSYVLHYFLVILWLTLMSSVVVEKDWQALRVVCLVTGLALANHILSLVLLALSAWTLLSLTLRKEIRPKQAMGWSLWLLPGLCFYLYIPLRAASDPVINWGAPDTIDRFLRYILRKDYVMSTYVADAGDLLGVVLFHARSFFMEFTPLLPILALALAAMIPLQRGKESEGVSRSPEGTFHLAMLGIALFLLNEFLLSLHGSHLDLFFLKRYSVPGYIGLYFSCTAVITWVLAPRSRRAFTFLVALLALIPVLCLFWHFEKNDRSRNTLLKSYVEQLLSHLPTGAALYAEGDNHLFPILYYHLVEGFRPDLSLLNPQLGLGRQADMAPLMKEGRLYSTHFLRTQEPIRCLPEGLVFRVAESGVPLRALEWRNFSEEEIRGARAPLEKILVTEYYHRRAVYHRSRGEMEEGFRWVRAMDTVAQGYDQTLILTGFAFANLGMVQESLQYFEAALKINPKNPSARFYLRKHKGKEIPPTGDRTSGSREGALVHEP
jgi:tetratricopeptide (TPR) repeat protein